MKASGYSVCIRSKYDTIPLNYATADSQLSLTVFCLLKQCPLLSDILFRSYFIECDVASLLIFLKAMKPMARY